MNNKYLPALALIVVVAVVLILVSSNFKSGSASSTPYNMVFSLTDPPQVPVGTTALVISYSSVQAHVVGSAGSGSWVNGSGSGTLDLMGLVNSSQVIGNVGLSANSSVNMIRFFINSADMTVNGTTYNVTVPSGQITATLNGNTRINSSSEALIDLSPTVAAIYTQNSTVFVMVPSVRAIIIPGRNTSASLGSKNSLNSTDKVELEASRPNITVTASSLSTLNNVTSFSVTVKNNANTSVIINHILLFGNVSISVNPHSEDASSNANVQASANDSTRASANDSASASSNHSVSSNQSGRDAVTVGQGSGISTSANIVSNASISGSSKDNFSAHTEVSASGNPTASTYGEDHGIHVVLPINANLSANASMNADVHALVNTGILIKTMKTTLFVVSSNATLSLPASEQEFGSNGYTLSPLASATFTFSGNMSLAEGHISASVVSGSLYKVVVKGQDGVKASVNLTAS
ncbi:MAG: DUF4382 domain-containing protein [Candidatus Micrarchaeaceae archaeon]